MTIKQIIENEMGKQFKTGFKHDGTCYNYMSYSNTTIRITDQQLTIDNTWTVYNVALNYIVNLYFTTNQYNQVKTIHIDTVLSTVQITLL